MMKRVGILVVCSLGLMAGNAWADRPTFENCDSAYNYGQNTAAFYVSAAMNRAACDASLTEKSEAALAKTLKKQKIPHHNPESFKVCFYEGLYDGYIAGLDSGYRDCNDHLGLLSVARAAIAVFTAMNSSLDFVDDGEVNQVFDGVFNAPSSLGNGCDDAIRSEVGDLGAGLEELVESVCWNS